MARRRRRRSDPLDELIGGAVMLAFLAAYAYREILIPVMVVVGVGAGSYFLIRTLKRKPTNTAETDANKIEGLTQQEVEPESRETYAQYLGRIGEDEIVKILMRMGEKYRIVRNVILGSGSRTTEIDVIFITEYGLYVIESKNYSGWIFGSEKQKEWTQTFPNGSKQRFYSPILQNKAHVSAVQSRLKNRFPELISRSVIVFNNSAILKKVPVSTDEQMILRTSDLETCIASSLTHFRALNSKVLFNPEQIETIYEELKSCTEGDLTQHIRNLRLKKVRQAENMA